MSAEAGSGTTCRIGSTLLPRRYTSPTLVARGGMGEVYRATDTVLERPVAVKLLSERHAREPEVRARFEREALAAARLSGARHVITVFDVGQHAGRPLIVMEYLDGGSVQDRLRLGPVPRHQALEWLAQTAEAIDRAHEHGIVHRDVKPANLLLDREGAIHVSDFGIATAAGLDTLTLPGTVLGTAGYLSPEQARGEPATPASDRYALGVVGFELLTGRRPFESDTATTEAFAHLNAPVPSAERLRPELPRGVDAVLARALAKDPADRPASCAELVADLREAFRGAAAPAVVSSGAPTRRFVRVPRRRPRSVYVLGSVGLLLAGLAVAALLGAGRDGSEPTTTRAPAAASTTSDDVEAPPPVDGAALNAQGFELMRAGEYQAALPILRSAVEALKGSRSLDEAYASYNLAFTRFALERCDGVLGLLDRSERIQGERREIDRLRDDWEERCAAPPADDDDDRTGERNGKGKGKGTGKGQGRGGD